jgi:hypothetical protein
MYWEYGDVYGETANRDEVERRVRDVAKAVLLPLALSVSTGKGDADGERTKHDSWTLMIAGS